MRILSSGFDKLVWNWNCAAYETCPADWLRFVVEVFLVFLGSAAAQQGVYALAKRERGWEDEKGNSRSMLRARRAATACKPERALQARGLPRPKPPNRSLLPQ